MCGRIVGRNISLLWEQVGVMWCTVWKNFLQEQIKTENCILLGFYTVSSGNFLSLFWENHYMLHNNPEEHRTQFSSPSWQKPEIMHINTAVRPQIITLPRLHRDWNVGLADRQCCCTVAWNVCLSAVYGNLNLVHKRQIRGENV